MQNRTPKPRQARPPLPEFTPVPRKYRHDGWTPERQKAFIEALADTGSVTRAAGMVNMAQTNCYALKRAPGAEEFRRAWEAALDFGQGRLKDIAFERAIEGELVPFFHAGKLVGYRRKYNNALLMFCIRHYGKDAGGKRTTINYFSSKAQAGVVGHEAGGGAAAEASTTTVRTVITGDGDARDTVARQDALAQELDGFEGIEFDAQAQAEMQAVLEALAERRRAANDVIEQGGEDAVAQLAYDPTVPFVHLGANILPWYGTLEPPPMGVEPEQRFADEPSWISAGAEMPAEWAEAIERMEAARDAPQISEVKRPKRKRAAK
jgi:hypothetical protein